MALWLKLDPTLTKIPVRSILGKIKERDRRHGTFYCEDTRPRDQLGVNEQRISGPWDLDCTLHLRLTAELRPIILYEGDLFSEKIAKLVCLRRAFMWQEPLHIGPKPQCIDFPDLRNNTDPVSWIPATILAIHVNTERDEIGDWPLWRAHTMEVRAKNPVSVVKYDPDSGFHKGRALFYRGDILLKKGYYVGHIMLEDVQYFAHPLTACVRSLTLPHFWGKSFLIMTTILEYDHEIEVRG